MPIATEFKGLVSADVLAAHLQEIIVEYESYKKQFRRAESREAFSIPVEATMLDADFNPVSAPFHMVTRDMSASGAGVFYDKPIDSEFLFMKFHSPISRKDFGVVAQVEHCTPCGRYFIVGCRFLAD